MFRIYSLQTDVQTSTLGCMQMPSKRRPGEVRDAIIGALRARPSGASVREITAAVLAEIGAVPPSSIRSYLQLNTPGLFARSDRAQYVLDERFLTPPEKNTRVLKATRKPFRLGHALLVQADCVDWLRNR